MGDVDIGRCLPCGRLRNISKVYKRRWGHGCPRCGTIEAKLQVEPLSFWEWLVVVPWMKYWNMKEEARVEASA